VPLDLLSVLHGVNVFVCESASDPWLEWLDVAPLLQRRRLRRRLRRFERLGSILGNRFGQNYRLKS
jgi:hypothetical protein